MSEHDHSHSHSPRGYILVFVGLLILTGISYAVARIDLGALDIPIMLGVAVVKATLVALVFMHLSEQRAGVRLVIVVSALFVVLIVVLTAGDVATRRTFPVGPQPPPHVLEQLDAQTR